MNIIIVPNPCRRELNSSGDICVSQFYYNLSIKTQQSFQTFCLSHDELAHAGTSDSSLMCSYKKTSLNKAQCLSPCRQKVHYVSADMTSTQPRSSFSNTFCSAGIYPALSGLPQGGPVRRPPAVLGLLPPPSHETFELLRLPAALRLVSPYVLTDRTLWPILRQDYWNRRIFFFFFT